MGASGPFGRLGGIGQSCGSRARRADRHFTSRSEGGGSRGDGFLQGKETHPREEAAEAQISCRRGLAGGRAAEQAGPVRTRPALFRGRRDSAGGPGAGRGAGARERGLSPIKRRPLRSLPNVPRTSPVFLLLLLRLLCCALASAPGHLKRFIQTWLCSALSRVGRSSAQDFPPWCFSPAPFLPLALMYPSLVSTSGPARVYL